MSFKMPEEYFMW